MRPHKHVYHKIWEQSSGKKRPPGWHIHHLDNNPNNNDPENLICVSPEMHAEIHLAMYNRYGNYKDAVAYNRLCGSKALSGYKRPKWIVDKIIESRSKGKGWVSWNKGKSGVQEYSEEMKSKISKSVSKYYDNRPGPRSREVVHLDTGFAFTSLKEGCDSLNIPYNREKLRMNRRKYLCSFEYI